MLGGCTLIPFDSESKSGWGKRNREGSRVRLRLGETAESTATGDLVPYATRLKL